MVPLLRYDASSSSTKNFLNIMTSRVQSWKERLDNLVVSLYSGLRGRHDHQQRLGQTFVEIVAANGLTRGVWWIFLCAALLRASQSAGTRYETEL